MGGLMPPWLRRRQLCHLAALRDLVLAYSCNKLYRQMATLHAALGAAGVSAAGAAGHPQRMGACCWCCIGLPPGLPWTRPSVDALPIPPSASLTTSRSLELHRPRYIASKI